MSSLRARRLRARQRAKAAAEACRRAAQDLAALASLDDATDEDVYGVMTVKSPDQLDELKDFVDLALGEHPTGVEVYVISGPNTGRTTHRPKGHRRQYVRGNSQEGVQRGRARSGA